MWLTACTRIAGNARPSSPAAAFFPTATSTTILPAGAPAVARLLAQSGIMPTSIYRNVQFSPKF
jgi:hypothetical protein